MGLRFDFLHTFLGALPPPPAQRITVGRIVVESYTEGGAAAPASEAGKGQMVLRVAIRKGVFGIADHSTTQLLLTALQQLPSPAERVLDLGTGSGVLAMAAACLGASEVVAVDTHRESAEAAREAVEANGLADAVTVHHGSAARARGHFDLVIANVGGSILLAQLSSIEAVLRPGGHLIASVTKGDRELVARRLDRFTEVRRIETCPVDVVLVDGEDAPGFRPDPEDAWMAMVLRFDPGPEVPGGSSLEPAP